MEVHLTTDQQAFVRQGVESGRYRGEEDALQEALSLWERYERRRVELLVAVDEAEASFSRGEARFVGSIAETVRLADDIKRRGLARLAAQEK